MYCRKFRCRGLTPVTVTERRLLRCAHPRRVRFSLVGLLKASCLSLLPAVAWTQGLLPCPSEIQALTVANTNDTATLARLLQCSNGLFTVEWFGTVVVSQTINITQGTSLSITGASSGATADGNHTTQLFAVDGASSLYLKDMTLANGDAVFGGAVHATEQATVSFSGSTTFAANTAWYGGAIFGNTSSTLFWDGEETSFVDNYASYGGAIMMQGSSDISWGGMTVFFNNSANNSGGAVYIDEFCEMSWSSKTTFAANTALYDHGGAIFAGSSSVVWDGEDTTFSDNFAFVHGGAILAHSSSTISWDGAAVFKDNKVVEGSGGAILLYNYSNGSWNGNTTFYGNFAVNGGAIKAEWFSTVSWRGETVFTSNNASFWGGGLYALWDSDVAWTGNTTFQNNFAEFAGGGVMIFGKSSGTWSGNTTFVGNAVKHTGGALDVHENSNVSWTGVTTFTGNSANRAGAIFMWKSRISWDGKTTFADNIAGLDGGAVYATVNTHIVSQGETIFRNNSAETGSAGALGIYGYSSIDGSYVNISGETTFTNNSAFSNGGAVFSSANPEGQYFEAVNFHSNSAGIGGAVATFGTGNGNEVSSFPTTFVNCNFFYNTAAETGGAVETAFGQETFISSHFKGNAADVGGALRLGGITTVHECSFISNMASNSGLAVAAVGAVAINGSYFHDNVFSCEKGKFLEEILKEDSGTPRYDTVCSGCPTWIECDDCTVSDSNLEPTCSNTLEHTSADECGRTLETLTIDNGYWRATKASDTVLACHNEDACLGGQTGTTTFCADGYMGPYELGLYTAQLIPAESIARRPTDSRPSGFNHLVLTFSFCMLEGC